MNGRGEVQRRALLATSGRAMVAALLGSTGLTSRLFANEHASSSDMLELRLAELIEAYDAQGNHRTATAVDNASAEWLAVDESAETSDFVSRLASRGYVLVDRRDELSLWHQRNLTIGNG